MHFINPQVQGFCVSELEALAPCVPGHQPLQGLHKPQCSSLNLHKKQDKTGALVAFCWGCWDFINFIFQLHVHHFPIFLNEKGLCPTKTFVHKIMLESLTLMLGCSWNLRPRAWQYRPYCFGSPDALWTPEATSRGSRVQRFVVCMSYGMFPSTALKLSSQ